MTPKPIITVRHLSVTYFPGRSNEVKALKDINLEIYPGEYIIFFGPSGCGKSTTLYSIAGLERNIEGDIIVEGQNLPKLSNHQLELFHQTTIGMIFQSYYLIPSLSVVQNVALPQVATRGSVHARTEKALMLLQKFGVGEQSKKLPTELSGGQQQRVALCRSLMNDPKIIVADEPVGNLDSKSTEDVMKLLRHLNDVEKKTVILVTHDPSHLHHANRIFYLRDGVITGTKVNTPEERNQSFVQQASLAASLSHWARTITTDSAVEHTRAVEAQEVLAEVLTGMNVEEMVQIEQTIHALLGNTRARKQTIITALCKPVAKGGIGMQRRKAVRLATEMMGFIQEIRLLRGRVKKEKQVDKDGDLTLTTAEAKELRRFILDTLDMQIDSPRAIRGIDLAIAKRLERTLDREGFIVALRSPLEENGAELPWRVARRIARRLEPFIPSSEPPSAPSNP